MNTSIPEKAKEAILSDLSIANRKFQKLYPGDTGARQAVHTVYGGANLFTSDTAAKMGEAAIASLSKYAPNFVVFASAMQLPGWDKLPQDKHNISLLVAELEKIKGEDLKNHPAWLPFTVYNKVRKKLVTEAVEDFRIDFEDGFGNRSDEEEDKIAVQAALEVAKGMKNNSLMPFIGIRIKPFTEDLKQRGIRTADIFITTLAKATKGKLPQNFVVMLPKVTIPEQVSALVSVFEQIEQHTDLAKGSLKLELMVETTQSIMNSEGKNPLRSLIDAGKGRCIATAFGTYDYTASCNITARYQNMGHPVCDFAHHMTRVALGHTGIFLADGATNIMPVGPHKGPKLTPQQQKDNQEVVHRAWKISYDHIRHSLWNGFYQGWDLHPAQLPARYAAIYSFFLESYENAAERLHNFMDAAARVTLSGDVFDDAATGQGLLNYFLSALNSGAISMDEIALTGLTLEEIQAKSFYKILKSRRKES